jgi:hypothetical protein
MIHAARSMYARLQSSLVSGFAGGIANSRFSPQLLSFFGSRK